MSANQVHIVDSSLRDGSHSSGHDLTVEAITRYCAFAERSGIPFVEVGHGNGLGGSSLLIGEATNSDAEMLRAARSVLQQSKLVVHVIPGLASLTRDVNLAIDCGVDLFRVASHCTEATVTKSYIEYLVRRGKQVHGVLMMTAHADIPTLVQNATCLQDYGASAVIIMDSTGSYLPNDVAERINALRQSLNICIGFHAHNNLGCAMANSISAVQNGASYIDVCIKGFGAGAGNTPLEVAVPVLQRIGFDTGIDFSQVISEADSASYLVTSNPTLEPINVLTGMHKLFSGFEKPIMAAAGMFEVPYHEIIMALGDRNAVAGQEDIILEVAERLSSQRPASCPKEEV